RRRARRRGDARPRLRVAALPGRVLARLLPPPLRRPPRPRRCAGSRDRGRRGRRGRHDLARPECLAGPARWMAGGGGPGAPTTSAARRGRRVDRLPGEPASPATRLRRLTAPGLAWLAESG